MTHITHYTTFLKFAVSTFEEFDIFCNSGHIKLISDRLKTIMFYSVFRVTL